MIRTNVGDEVRRPDGLHTHRPSSAGEASDSVAFVFSETARRWGSRTALTCGASSASYAELEARSDAIARGLISRGVKHGETVGLYMGRSIETVAAILGVLKAGAAYVPFDPSYPRAMLEFIHNDSAPTVIIAQLSLLESKTAMSFGNSILLDVAEDFPLTVATRIPLPIVRPDDRAYIMYTSGSTGRPKGVQIPHRAILRLVIDNDFAHFGADETVLHMAPLAFDASTFEIWAALLHGGRLAIMPAAHPSLDDIAAIIAKERITTAWLTAGLFHLMVDHRLDGLRPLKQLLAGGDVLSVEHVSKALAALPDCRLINGYGPTENTTFSCCYTIPRSLPPGPIPIGRTIRRSESLILDGELNKVADGMDGELYVGGPGLALGYVNRPELDAERFIANPFDATPGARLYRTGDRVRMRADGNLEFLGRVDRQVKINGKRVELDEIEATIRRSGLVRDAAVTTFDAAGSRRIAAYVAGDSLSTDAVRSFLRVELPDYMQPGVFIALDALPLSPTGKVDRAKLPPPVVEKIDAPLCAPPKTELEARLLKIWSEVLGTNLVGVDDNFFDLGGTSLQMMKVHAAVGSSLSRSLTIVDLFTYPRVSALAGWLSQPEAATTMKVASVISDAQERARKQSAALARARSRPGRPMTASDTT